MTLKEKLKKEPEGVVARAYRLSERAHAAQKRKTGDPYFNHPKAVGETLLEWQLDDVSVAAGLLHDVAEDTAVSLEELRKEFGDEIASLVDGVTKLGRIKYRGGESDKISKAENLRKMFLALSEDLRVVFIKLADRLHNMHPLRALPREKQERIALETDDIYAPIAYRLGMQNLSGTLHDLAFPYLHPEEDKWLKNTVKDAYAEREKYLARMRPKLAAALKAHGITPREIDFRAKRYSSLYHKLLRYNMDMSKIYDLVAMRVIVDSVPECYAVLGVIHQLWPPLPGRIKDYIAMPKPNGYRSLHTTVIGPDEKYVEIQVRTQQMHEENENGIAAHWLYEQNKRAGESVKSTLRRVLEDLKWVQQLRRWQEKFTDVNSEEFLQSMKVDFFKDRIFAITPKGDVIDLPAGSTPVDFAYHIHSEIGDECVGARVNDEFVPLNHALKSGDLVQILIQKGKRPSEDWLKFAKTSIAKEHIRAAIREKDRRLLASAPPSKVEFRIVAKKRMGLLKDISAAINQSHFSIASMNTVDQPSGDFPVIKVQCETTDKKKIEKLVLKLKHLDEIKEVSYQLV